MVILYFHLPVPASYNLYLTMRHTKIIATIGPARAREGAIRELVAAGVDVFRLNFSHGTHETHGERHRAASGSRHRMQPATVAILQDLSGPKIRTGTLRGRTAA